MRPPLKLRLHVERCHPECPWCAQHFWTWVKDRMANFSRRKGGVMSFTEAAATSIKAGK